VAGLRRLKRQLESIRVLSDIVAAMRDLAAICVRHAEAAVRATRPYAELVETALDEAMKQADLQQADRPADASAVAVVFTSEQGLCGAYNDRVVRRALEFMREAPGPKQLVAIGRRGRDLLALQGAKAALSLPGPTNLEAIRNQVLELAAQVFELYSERGASELFFVYNAYAGMGRFQETVRQVLPVSAGDLQASRERAFSYEPILTAPPRELLGQLIEEYFFIEFYRGLLESHASENGARLASMTTATTNIEERIVALTRRFQSVRQEDITAELLDVVSGAEALRTDR